MRRLQAAGFVEPRRGKASHRQFVHPDNPPRKRSAPAVRAVFSRRRDCDAILPHHCRAGEQRHRERLGRVVKLENLTLSRPEHRDHRGHWCKQENAINLAITIGRQMALRGDN
jgi:hypothetical protein